MLRLRGHRRTGGEAGFTLVEILVVILLIAILAGIAIPAFQGAKRSGWNSKAQAGVRSALSAQRTYYVDYQKYTTDAAALRRIEPNLTYDSTDANQGGVVSVIPGSITPADSAVVLVTWSQSGTLFCIMNIAQDLTGGNANGQTTAGTYYAKADDVATPPASPAASACGASYTRSESNWQ